MVVPAFDGAGSAYPIVNACAEEYLRPLTTRTKLVLLLGNSDSYMIAISDLIAKVRGPVVRINPVAFDSNGVRFVHVAHPSKGNGHLSAFVQGRGTTGAKRDLARAALFGDLSSW